MIKTMAKIANELDNQGFGKEADMVDGLIKSALMFQERSWWDKKDFLTAMNGVDEDIKLIKSNAETIGNEGLKNMMDEMLHKSNDIQLKIIDFGTQDFSR